MGAAGKDREDSLLKATGAVVDYRVGPFWVWVSKSTGHALPAVGFILQRYALARYQTACAITKATRWLYLRARGFIKVKALSRCWDAEFRAKVFVLRLQILDIRGIFAPLVDGSFRFRYERARFLWKLDSPEEFRKKFRQSAH